VLPDVVDLTTRATEWIAWADGYEEVNEQRARMVRAFARDVLELCQGYLDEQSGRLAMQGNYERALGVITSRAYEVGLLERASSEAPKQEASTGPF
jgi:hypothetical protein